MIASESAEGTKNEVFRTRVEEIWQVLVKHCDSAEEGNRNIAAECLGKLCLIDSSKFLGKLLVRMEGRNVGNDPGARF